MQFGKSFSELKMDIRTNVYCLDPTKRSEQEKQEEQCRNYCLGLISSAQKTEAQLRRKLKDSGKYTEEVIEQTISFLKEYGYLDDSRYAAQYISFYQGTKSRKEIEKKLYEKGLDRNLIRESMDGMDAETERQAAEKFLAKKCKNISILKPEERRKLAASLMRRGFSYEIINRLLSADFCSES